MSSRRQTPSFFPAVAGAAQPPYAASEGGLDDRALVRYSPQITGGFGAGRMNELEDRVAQQERSTATLVERAFKIREDIVDSLNLTQGSWREEKRARELLQDHIRSITDIVRRINYDIQSLESQLRARETQNAQLVGLMRQLEVGQVGGVTDVRGRVLRCDAAINRLSADVGTASQTFQGLAQRQQQDALNKNEQFHSVDTRIRKVLSNLDKSHSTQSDRIERLDSSVRGQLGTLESKHNETTRQIEATIQANKQTERQERERMETRIIQYIDQIYKQQDDRMNEMNERIEASIQQTNSAVDDLVQQKKLDSQHLQQRLKEMRDMIDSRLADVEVGYVEEIRRVKKEYRSTLQTMKESVQEIKELFESKLELTEEQLYKEISQDGHTDSRGRLKIDRQQDYILDEVTVTKDGYLAVEFHRLLDTCDQDDYLIDSGTTHMLVFSVSGELDTIQNLDITSTHPILQRSQLIKSQLPDPVLPSDTKTFVMHVDNVKVPQQETTYWCALRKLPELKEKHHLIQFEGAISKTGEGTVHHLEVFHCTVPDHVTLPEYDAQCVNSGRPKGLESCMKVLGAWAMGAKPVSYPEEAGSPVGGPGFSRYVMLEVHYNNPELKKGIVDSSGLKFYITPTLRRYDAGIMELGLEYTDKMALPPGQQAVKLVGYCVPECTQVAFPRDGIKVFASQLHTHLTGRAAYTKHYRQGVELPELNRDNHFSPHYQEIRKLPRQVHVLPGDSLVTTCIDRTVERPNVTLGGFAIIDEMCVNYIHYYPLVDLEVCKSSVTTESLYGFFNFLNLYQDERTSNRSGISDNYKSIRWTPMNTALLESYYEEAPLSMQCNRSDGTRHPGRSWEDIPVPEIIQPMPDRVRPCLQ